MLNALELYGFKSFAERTRFEFPPGITVIVGPNGSGKSNIVDAIKWVLGEQSAKSLRGKEMADVIFKGSGSGGRRPANTAEATIIFDNSSGQLAVDAQEMRVTRRVYRSGEGEYLINGQACRLRDIKDMFRGTGVGADAYSLIEQGKVDTLLQSSAKDRRAIFEEAAGISRFKAKKVESQRRLARVEQNLVRLSDIVDEVESRLRSVRAQAAKARRFKEYRERLQQLRTQVGRADWQKLTEKLAAAEEQTQAARSQQETEQAALDETASQLAEIDARAAELEQTRHAIGEDRLRIQQRLAGAETTLTHLRRQVAQREEEEVAAGSQLAALVTKANDLRSHAEELANLIAADEEAVAVLEGEAADLRQALRELKEQRQQHLQAAQTERESSLEILRRSAALGSEIAALRSQIEAAESTALRCETRLADVEERLDREAGELEELRRQAAARREEAEDQHQALLQLDAQIEQARRQSTHDQEQLAQLGLRRAGLHERLTVLAELEERREGYSAGVKDALERAAAADSGPFREICGVVADVITAPVEYAAAIDAALGQRAKWLVVSGFDLLEQAATGQVKLAGRAALAPLQVESGDNESPPTEVGGPGVIGRADRLVETDAQFRWLVRRLLGGVWVVESLARAVELRHEFPRVASWVTRQGESLSRDGVLHVGRLREAAGIVSRRSHLRELGQEAERLDQQLDAIEATAGRNEQELQQLIARREKLLAVQRQTAQELAQLEERARGAEEKCRQLEMQRESFTAEIEAADRLRRAATADYEETQALLTACDAEAERIRARMEIQDKESAELAARSDALEGEATEAQVRLAAAQQSLDALRARLDRFQMDQQGRDVAQRELRQRLADSSRRRLATELEILKTEQTAAALEWSRQELFERLRALNEDSSQLDTARRSCHRQSSKITRQIRELEDQRHRLELAANEVRLQRESLAQRLRDDYGIELADLDQAPSEEELAERQEVDQEIADLRRKLANIGSVNMEALEELEDLEARFAQLSGQHNDLTGAKQSLERIIHRINADSRRLFSETLEAVRSNFQTLFRKVFGGGTADIVLEEGADILEAGIEIIANPPGKHALNISLLSGGERALTAVTLLLAIFQFRPSPFCVLDEVDGPLDEANIGRFIGVLKDFLKWTRFVVVTHSKKTMTAANTLYGVTMQESGVSKRVSVQFDDVSETGEIDAAAVEGGDDGPGDERGAA